MVFGRMAIKLYPDRRWPAFLRVLADTVTALWTIAWAYVGCLIYQVRHGFGGDCRRPATLNSPRMNRRRARVATVPLQLHAAMSVSAFYEMPEIEIESP